MEKIKKIKEDIDLKELEKYGYEEENGTYVKHTNDTDYGYQVNISIDPYTRIIEKCFCWTCFSFNVEKYIQDLIKADYVEEIEWKSK